MARRNDNSTARWTPHCALWWDHKRYTHYVHMRSRLMLSRADRLPARPPPSAEDKWTTSKTHFHLFSLLIFKMHLVHSPAFTYTNSPDSLAFFPTLFLNQPLGVHVSWGFLMIIKKASHGICVKGVRWLHHVVALIAKAFARKKHKAWLKSYNLPENLTKSSLLACPV